MGDAASSHPQLDESNGATLGSPRFFYGRAALVGDPPFTEKKSILWCATWSSNGPSGSGMPLDVIDDNVDPRSASPAGIGLLRFYGCITCHDLALPPFRRRWGPDLDTVGSKTTADWIDRFLANSEDVQPGRTMPGVPLAGDERAHLVAFLAAQTIKLSSSPLGEASAANVCSKSMNVCVATPGKASAQRKRPFSIMLEPRSGPIGWSPTCSIPPV